MNRALKQEIETNENMNTVTEKSGEVKPAATEVEIVAPVDEQLILLADKSGLQKTQTSQLIEAFRPIFTDAKKALSDAVGVAESVKDATCVSEIKQARACRLAIRRVRIEGDKIRKAQKADALNYGRLVEGFYGMIEANLAPVEKALQDAEDTAERAETARKDALEVGRKAALAPYVPDVSIYPVRDMAEPVFAALLTGVRVAKEQADAAKAKAEVDRIAREAAEKAEQERIRQENARLQREAQEREAARIAEAERLTKEMMERDRKAAEERHAAAVRLQQEQERAANAQREAEAAARAQREAAAAALKAEQDRLNAIAAAERAKAVKAAEEAAAKAKAQRDADLARASAMQKAAEDGARVERLRLQALAEVERQKTEAARAAAESEAHKQRVAREQAEQQLREAAEKEAARVAAETEAARQAAAAPDKTKLIAYAAAVRALGIPALVTPEAQSLGNLIASQREKFASWISDKAGAL